jgi:hypothetical protein
MKGMKKGKMPLIMIGIAMPKKGKGDMRHERMEEKEMMKGKKKKGKK